METDKAKQYIYIVQATKEDTKCKIGKTNDLDRRLNDYNNRTGKSKENVYQYLFTCEVADMSQVENDIKNEFSKLREQKSREIYFYNNDLIADYANFIKSHKLFVKEIAIKTPKEKIKIVKEKQKTLEERSMTQGDLMRKAKKKANAIQKNNSLSGVIEHDEFYTRYEDIEKEVENYKDFFDGKVVFCNCDDPYIEGDEGKSSAFALYFYKNFKKLKLKKLICLHYSGGVDLFNQGSSGIIFTTDGEKWEKQNPTGFNGSFDHPLSIKILKDEADIVCTNPPFSRAIEYWMLIINSGKNFLIISNISNAVNTAYIKYFKNGQVQSGINRVDYFINQKGLSAEASGHWYTNFPIKKYNSTIKIMPLAEIAGDCKQYDDSGTLIISRCNIPNDYDAPFAVSTRPILQRVLDYGYKIVQETQYIAYIEQKKQGSKVLIQKKEFI
jgi:hypothetical protein